MSKRRIDKKKGRKTPKALMDGMMERMDRQEQAMGRILERLEEQQEILGLYYRTYQEMKTQSQKKYLLAYIRMRDEMLKDSGRLDEHGIANEELSGLLGIYIEEYNTLLEDNGVEILSCRVNDEFEPEFQKPLKKVDVGCADLDHKIIQVYGQGYRWNGTVLKKIQVAVGVYKK